MNGKPVMLTKSGGWPGKGWPADDLEPFIPLDYSDALVAVAYDDAKAQIEKLGFTAQFITSRTPQNARAALDRMLKQAREDALREAAEQIAPDPNLDDVETSAKVMRRACSSEILALIEKEKTDG